jgi:hypothetical protein
VQQAKVCAHRSSVRERSHDGPQPEQWFIIIQGSFVEVFRLFSQFVQHYATLIALFAMNQHHFALAQ